eukprot:CAMPEP_0183332240 /NCGR_PEP_ID=MMETSP0164_2-20130417/1457_1 /TAXON_ID=221442 /ORGANISM="Coccolithus pelagicus ssp braarudi, Strain PLY182g" /LENGTH=74 /DNA_ID=CAMNT_0025500913 /DNA_START=82 /DNA_END=306 /DNA_ORIENTATION=+
MSDPKPNKDLLAGISKGAELKKTTTQESSTVTQAKVQLELKKGAKLKHVDAPKADVSDAVKKAFVEDQKEKDSK